MKKIVTIAAIAALTALAACGKQPEADNTAVNATDAATAAPSVGGGKPAEGGHQQEK